jgi:hypothetical protein
MLENEIARIEMPEYLRRVKLSNKRKAVYYEQGKKTVKAKRLLDRSRFNYRGHKVGSRVAMLLTDLKTGERVVANPRSQGTPKMFTINGQGIYDQTLQKQVRNKVMQVIKIWFAPFINQLPYVNVPIRIYAELHDTILTDKGAKWDLDNRFYMYQKAFQDCLTGNRDREGIAANKVIVDDDNVLYITQPPCPLFIPVATEEERKLVFILCEEKDSRIIENEEYKKLRNVYTQDTTN